MSTPAAGQQLSQEQINQMLKRMLVQETHVQGLFGENLSNQQRQQALQQLIDGAVQEAVTRATLMHQQEFGKFRGEFDGAQGLLQELYREHSMGRFLNDYPELKDYRKLIDDAVNEVSGLPEVPKSMEEFFQRVAQATEGRVKALRPEFALPPRGAGAAPQQGQPQGGAPAPGAPSPTAGTGAGSPQPPTYTGPSGPSAGGAGAAGKTSPGKVSSIWDDPA